MFKWLTNSSKVQDLESRIRMFRAMLGMELVEEFEGDIEYRIRYLRMVEKFYFEEMERKRELEKSAVPKKNSRNKKTTGLKKGPRKNFENV